VQFVVNGVTVLRGRVFNTTSQPGSGIAAALVAPGINTDLAGGAFYPGVNADTITDFSDADGIAPSLPLSSFPFLVHSLRSRPIDRRSGSDGFNLTIFSELGTLDSGAWVNFGTCRLDRLGGVVSTA
jgi:hypothetical protein